MKKIIFRSPILVLACTLLIFACDQDSEIKGKDFSSEISKGWKLEQKASAFQSRGMADSAFTYFTEARKYYEKASDSMRIVYALLKTGEIQYQYNDFAEMQVTMVEALKYLDKKSAKAYSPAIYNNLGIAYAQLEDYQRAIQNYNKTKALSLKPVDDLTAESNIAHVDILSGNYESAKKILEKAYTSPHIGDSLPVKARVEDNLGYVLFKLGSDDAIEMLNKGLQSREKIGDFAGMGSSCLNLAHALSEKSRSEALSYATRAEFLSLKTHSPDDRLLALKFLASHSEPALARKYSQIYFKVADSLQSARRKARNHFAEVKYNYKYEREEKIRAKANQAQLQLREVQLENSRLLWLLVSVCVVFLSIIAIYKINRRHRRTRWKASYEAEVRISNRLHDEMANDLHQAIVFTEANDISEKGNRSKLLDALDLLYRRARAVSRETGSVGTTDFEARLKELISFYWSEAQKVVATGIGNIQWNSLHEQKQVAIHRSVQELLVNMKKHSNCTTALLQFAMEGKTGIITYSDNGVGTGAGKISKNGLLIMENRIHDIKGTVTFGEGTGKGFRARIEFPI